MHIPYGVKLCGQASGDAIDAFAMAFPAVYLELFDVSVAGNVVVVYLR